MKILNDLLSLLNRENRAALYELCANMTNSVGTKHDSKIYICILNIIHLKLKKKHK